MFNHFKKKKNVDPVAAPEKTVFVSGWRGGGHEGPIKCVGANISNI